MSEWKEWHHLHAEKEVNNKLKEMWRESHNQILSTFEVLININKWDRSICKIIDWLKDWVRSVIERVSS